MHRTTILLEDRLKDAANVRARQMGISLGELIRLSLKSILGQTEKKGIVDALFVDRAVFSGEVPLDLAAHHDDYLYGDDS